MDNRFSALEKALQAVGRLAERGIPVELHAVSRRFVAEKDATYAVRVPPSAWLSIRFRPETPEQAEQVYFEQRLLATEGVGFDSGGGSAGGPDWELDWSLRESQQDEASELQDRQADVHRLVADMRKENHDA